MAITIIDKIAQQLYFDKHSDTPTSPVEAKYSERKEELCELHVEAVPQIELSENVSESQWIMKTTLTIECVCACW